MIEYYPESSVSDTESSESSESSESESSESSESYLHQLEQEALRAELLYAQLKLRHLENATSKFVEYVLAVSTYGVCRHVPADFSVGAAILLGFPTAMLHLTRAGAEVQAHSIYAEQQVMQQFDGPFRHFRDKETIAASAILDMVGWPHSDETREEIIRLGLSCGYDSQNDDSYQDIY